MTNFDERRFGLITGSKCVVLFPKRSVEVGQRTYARELAQQKYFKFYDDQSSWQTEHGNDMEQFAFDYYRDNYDKDIQPGSFQMKDEYFGGTSDAVGVDFKCPTTLNKWLEYLQGVDAQQYHQAQMYMYLFGLQEWKIAAYLVETWRMTENGIQYPVAHDKRMITTTVKKEDGWESKLKERGLKLIEQRDEFYQDLIKKFGPIQ
jgi:hypothetical protein